MRAPFAGMRRTLRAGILLEAGAALLFFGSLVHHPELLHSGTQALRELGALGYTIPTVSHPVRIYPAITGGSLDSAHAGGWRPGVISLRETPRGGLGEPVYLRHELMHEASFRTCSGKLPLWAEEAAAIHFSGELSGLSFAEEPTEGELDHLRNRNRIGASLDAQSYKAVSKLVALHGWPREPCAVPETIQKLLNPPRPSSETGFACILISLLSGRVLESKGDLQSRHPPGSLLKIPYAASLAEDASDAIGEELAASDTARLLKRKDRFDPDRFRFLISTVGKSPLGRSLPGRESAENGERFFRQYLGERDEAGGFPFQANLRELALALRASLLFKPGSFAGLARNGFFTGSTLYAEPARDKRVLEKLHAMAKTGSVSDERGLPVVGHLMVAWPAEDPLYLAVFRNTGTNGASTLGRASKLLEEWSVRHPIGSGKVRVLLLSLIPPASRQTVDECPSFERKARNGWLERVSTCGQFQILSSARGSRSERTVSGILETSPDNLQLVLNTDSETYADGVLAMEAQDLKGEAARALRAVIVWNGSHGATRHQESSSLCDTTHCMVFQGEPTRKAAKQESLTDSALLDILDELSALAQLDWLPFSKGGEERWERQIPAPELARLVDEPSILEIRRNRTRGADIFIHLVYPEGEEIVPCETFRNRLKLPSCPETVRADANGSAWFFEGIGEGHGQGFSVERARALATSGSAAPAILEEAYRAR